MAKVTVRAQAFDPGRGRRARLLDHLREGRLVDQAAIERAELVAVRTHQPIEQVLNQLGSLTDDALVAAYAEVGRCGIWHPEQDPPLEDPTGLGVPTDFLRVARLIPLAAQSGELVCAACDPLDDTGPAGLAFASGRTVRILAARPADYRRAAEAVFGLSGGAPIEADKRRLEREVDLISDTALEGGGARLVSAIFEAAVALGASDIHFEPRRHEMRVRFRIDGRLLDHTTVSADLSAPAVSRIKVIANLNLGERRLPQDGRTTFVVQGKQIDVRVATSPTVFGESAVLRILDRQAVPLDLNGMGLSADIADVLVRASRSPHGIFLVTGPTGSGKTTTLYALLQTFTGSDRKLLSVEDPVEYHFEHVTQTQVAPQLGLTFASALRSFLRQDPDVILVGEIRDPETAAVAIQAAMTGHLVLASIHANDAMAVLPRLQDMGVEPYQMAAAFRGAVAQRLVRRLCPSCRVEAPVSAAQRRLRMDHGLVPPARAFVSTGCSACRGAGFKGRVPIAEGFIAPDALLRAIAEHRTSADLSPIARDAGLRTMLVDGLEKADLGLTTDEEVLAAVDV